MKLVDVAPERLKWSSTVFFRNHSSSKKESLKKRWTFFVKSINSRVELKGTNLRT